jgi:DegV family protein with EDD domain
VTGLDVTVIDSHCVCAPLGLIVIELARAAERGMGLSELVALAGDLSDRARVLFSVGTLDNLARGGRIGRAQALVGKVARIQPILTVEEGVVAVAGKARGDARAMQWVTDFADRELDGAVAGPLGVVHSGRPDVVEWAYDTFASRFGFAEVVPFELGAIVGAHTGPGTWGVSYLRPVSSQ